MQILKEATSYKAAGEAVQMSLPLMCYYADPIYLTASNLGFHETAPDYRLPTTFKRPCVIKKKIHSQPWPFKHIECFPVYVNSDKGASVGEASMKNVAHRDTDVQHSGLCTHDHLSNKPEAQTCFTVRIKRVLSVFLAL